jgi:hypothetical protein
MVTYYIESGSYWRHNKTGRVYFVGRFDFESGDCLLFDDAGRQTAVKGDVLESLYSEIDVVRARRLVEQAGRHGWDKMPSRPIDTRPPIKIAMIVNEPKRGPGRPRKIQIA